MPRARRRRRLRLSPPDPSSRTNPEALSERASAGDYLPVLVITADITERTKEEALTLGTNEFLSKPFDGREASPAGAQIERLLRQADSALYENKREMGHLSDRRRAS